MNSPFKNCIHLAVALSIAMTVLGFRLHLIHQHGLQFPINDQWYSEYETLYKPFCEGRLKFSDLFLPNNEHVVAFQKGIQLALLIATGEWNPMAQMFLNALFFSTLLFWGALLAGLYLGPVSSVVFQAAILACGLMPGPAENFLFDFQTGWYVYYFLSAIMLWGPKYCSAVKWAAKMDSAVCSKKSDPIDLLNKIECLSRDKFCIKEFSQKTTLLADSDFNPLIIHQKFSDFLSEQIHKHYQNKSCQ